MKSNDYLSLKARMYEEPATIDQAAITDLETHVRALLRRSKTLLFVVCAGISIPIGSLFLLRETGTFNEYGVFLAWLGAAGLVIGLVCSFWSLDLHIEARETGGLIEVLSPRHTLCRDAYSAQTACPEAQKLAESVRRRAEPLRIFHAHAMVRMAAEFQCKALHEVVVVQSRVMIQR